MLLTDKIITFEQILFELLLGLNECIRIEFADRSDIDPFLQILAKRKDCEKVMHFIDSNGLNLNIRGRIWIKIGSDYLHIKDDEFIRVRDM